MLDAGEYDPYKLGASLSKYYDTSLNRANVVLFEIKRLLKLQLDLATTPVQFISDFRDCLQRLRKNIANVADDDQTLRALLLVAIQDESLESIRDNIWKHRIVRLMNYLVILGRRIRHFRRRMGSDLYMKIDIFPPVEHKYMEK